MRNSKFVTIQEWMLDLDLSGNELICYAIIYGFSQGMKGCFHGSREYLARWMRCTTRTASTTLKGLIEKGLIIKEEHAGRASEYMAVEPEVDDPVNGNEDPGKNFKGGKNCNTPLKNLQGTPENISTDNYIDIHEYKNTIDEADTSSSSESVVQPAAKDDKKRKSPEYSKQDKEFAQKVLDYLNRQTGRRYSATGENIKFVCGRLHEGRDYSDFVKVIDLKCKEWLGNPKMSKYVQPSTLFRPTNFDNYLNEAISANAWRYADCPLYDDSEPCNFM